MVSISGPPDSSVSLSRLQSCSFLSICLRVFCSQGHVLWGTCVRPVSPDSGPRWWPSPPPCTAASACRSAGWSGGCSSCAIPAAESHSPRPRRTNLQCSCRRSQKRRSDEAICRLWCCFNLKKIPKARLQSPFDPFLKVSSVFLIQIKSFLDEI